MELLVPLGAAALAAVPAILLLYFLRVRGSEVPVGIVALWPPHLVDRQANRPWKRLRLSWLLLVQLLVAAALALTLMRPGLPGAGGVGSTTVVLIDGSPSMLATDVAPSRFEAAVARAGALASQLRPGQQMAVAVLGRHAELLTPATGDAGTIRAALRRARPSGAAADLEEGISLAGSLVGGRPGASVVLLSDGHMRPPDQPPSLAAPLRYESFGRTGENVTVESLGWTATGEVAVRVSNVGPAARELSLEMRADGRLVDILPVRVEAGASAESVWPRLPASTEVLEARLSPGDALGVDDRAWLVTRAPARRRVLLVTKGNGFVSRALAVREDLDVVSVDPAGYRPGPYDLTVLDGFVPPGPLPQPALLIAPPPGTGPVPLGGPIDPGGLLPADPREPLLQYVSLRDVHVQAAGWVALPPDWRAVVSATNGPLLVVHRAEPRLAQLNFDVHQSDLPLRAAFPVLVQNLVSYLMPGGFENQILPLGQPVRLATGPGTTSVEVTTPSGRVSRLRPPFPATLADTSTPGVYGVREMGGAAGRPAAAVDRRFVVQLQDLDQSRIAPGPRPVVRTVSASAGDAHKGTLEVWPWILALGLAAVVTEWVLFLRG